jgi:hypothetical protein
MGRFYVRNCEKNMKSNRLPPLTLFSLHTGKKPPLLEHHFALMRIPVFHGTIILEPQLSSLQMIIYKYSKFKVKSSMHMP